MYMMPSSTILSRSDTGDSDASVPGSFRTPSPSSDADEVDSDAEVEAILTKKAELDRQYQELLTARRVNRQANLHNESRSRREGGRIKNKWCAVKVTPSKKQIDAQVQEQFVIEQAGSTSPMPHKVKPWMGYLRNENHTSQIQAQREHGHPQPPETTLTEGVAHDDKAVRTTHELHTSRMERHMAWNNPPRQACIPLNLLASNSRTSEPEPTYTADNKAVPTSSDPEEQENSDEALSAVTAMGSDNGKKCEQRTLENFGHSHLRSRSTASTQAIDAPTSASDDQEVRKDQGCHDSDRWCQTKTSKCPRCKNGCSLCDEAPDDFLRDEPYAFERAYNVPRDIEVPDPCEVTEMPENLKRGIATIPGIEASNAQVRTEENANSLQCSHCTTTFSTCSPIAYCPGCGQFSGLHTHHAASPTDAESALYTTSERTVGEEQATESLTPPQPSDKSHPDTSEGSLEQAMLTLGLERYISVSMSTLQLHLNKSLDGPACRSEAASAFATIVEHQNAFEHWENRLRWNEVLDKVLLCYGLESDHTGRKLASVAYTLYTSLADCQQRWEHIKPKRALSPPYEADNSDSKSLTTSKGWDAERDQRLIEMKTYPTHSWFAIARELGVNVKECKQRFKKIKLKDCKPKTKRQVKREAKSRAFARDAPVSKIGGFSHATDKVAHVSAYGACTTSNPCGWMDCTLCAHDDNAGNGNQGHRYECDCRVGWCTCDGLGTPAPADVPEGCEQCGVSTAWCQCEPTSASDQDDAQESPSDTRDADGWGNTNYWGDSGHVQKPYTVTYWATVESEGGRIHVPIDSKHVSGPEKTIVNGGMQKVWEWIHDKGLGDKVGLQDAFDLGQAMHEDEGIKEVKTGKGGRKIESRLSYHTPGTDSWHISW